MKVFCKEFITVWTRGLVRWLSQKFDSISIDLTPVENKLDEVKSDVADVKTAVEHIDFTTVNNKIDAVGEKVDAVDGKVGELTDIIEAINGDTVDNIVNGYIDGEAEEIQSIIGDWSEQESES